MILFADRGCPFAHRVLALFDHLGHAPDLRESMVGEKPTGLEQYSASGAIPLLVDDDLVLTESRVMLDHLAEHYSFTDAYPANQRTRSLHRLSMALVDNFLAPLLFTQEDAYVDSLHLEDVISTLEAATLSATPQANLLAMHVAPIWLRFQWWLPLHQVTRTIEARRELCDWLDAAVQLDCLQNTQPDPVLHEEDLGRARQAGLLPG